MTSTAYFLSSMLKNKLIVIVIICITWFKSLFQSFKVTFYRNFMSSILNGRHHYCWVKKTRGINNDDLF